MYNMQREYELAQLRQMKAALDPLEATARKLQTLQQEIKVLDSQIQTSTVLNENYDRNLEARTKKEYEEKKKKLSSKYNEMPLHLRLLYIAISIVFMIASSVLTGFLCPQMENLAKVEVIVCVITVGCILCTAFYWIANIIFSALNESYYFVENIFIGCIVVTVCIAFPAFACFSGFWANITAVPSILMGLIPYTGILAMTFCIVPFCATANKKKYKACLTQLRAEEEHAIRHAKENDKKAQQAFQNDYQKDKELREITYPKLWKEKQEQFQEFYKVWQQQMQVFVSVNVLGNRGKNATSAYIERLIQCIDGREADSIKEAVNIIIAKDQRNWDIYMHNKEHQDFMEHLKATEGAIKKIHEENKRYHQNIEDFLKGE